VVIVALTACAHEAAPAPETAANRGASPPSVTSGSVAKYTGKLAPDIIQATVRDRFDVFRDCFASASTKRGRVEVFFVIGADGHVREASSRRTTIDEPDVVECMVDGFRALTFEAPVGGEIGVVYPIVFSDR
jgi:hypothetical protein